MRAIIRGNDREACRGEVCFLTAIQQEIRRLAREKDALILAHYYQRLDVQDVADAVGDSFELARRAQAARQRVIVLCGVRFMAESAKILNPQKTVLLPAPDAGCPMAEMVDSEAVRALRAKHPDAAVVCYVNSSAAVKAECDICCTSSSAVRVVRSLPNRRVIFVPDQNLGAYAASQVPEKEFILYDGFCPIHHQVSARDALAAKAAHPRALLLAHPECPPEVLALADYVGSTSGILAFAEQSEARELIICTELGIVELLKRRHPEKGVYPLSPRMLCTNMKKTRPEDVLESLRHGVFEIELSEGERLGALQCLERMMRA